MEGATSTRAARLPRIIKPCCTPQPHVHHASVDKCVNQVRSITLASHPHHTRITPASHALQVACSQTAGASKRSNGGKGKVFDILFYPFSHSHYFVM